MTGVRFKKKKLVIAISRKTILSREEDNARLEENPEALESSKPASVGKGGQGSRSAEILTLVKGGL